MYKFNPHVIAEPQIHALYLVVDGDYQIIDGTCDLEGFKPDRFAEHVDLFSGLFVMPDLIGELVDVFCRTVGIGTQTYSTIGLVVYDPDIDEWDSITFNPETGAWYVDQEAENQYAILQLFHNF